MLLSAYYRVKPLIPRRLQIAVRRVLIARRLRKVGDIWPIDPRAARAPERWSGWPDGKKFALVLTHDVEGERGLARCLPLAGMEELLGFRSSFNFVAEDYQVSPSLRRELIARGFEVGLHGLSHDGLLYRSKREFFRQALRINRYLREWQAVGFRSPAMHRNLEWLGHLDIEYDASTFDSDPFEPQPEGSGTIFPFLVGRRGRGGEYVELPYTLSQDFTLFVLMQQKSIDIWKRKLDWIVEQGGMALLIAHPDFMKLDGTRPGREEYPCAYYQEFLDYITTRYHGQYWNALPKEVAHFWRGYFGSVPRPAV
jgi:hypothetical protein